MYTWFFILILYGIYCMVCVIFGHLKKINAIQWGDKKTKIFTIFFFKYFLFHPEMVQTFSFLLFFLNIDIKKVFTVPHESFLCISYSNFCSLSLHHFAEYLIEKNLISLFSDQQSFFLNFWWPWHWMFSHMPDWEMVSCECWA